MLPPDDHYTDSTLLSLAYASRDGFVVFGTEAIVHLPHFFAVEHFFDVRWSETRHRQRPFMTLPIWRYNVYRTAAGDPRNEAITAVIKDCGAIRLVLAKACPDGRWLMLPEATIPYPGARLTVTRPFPMTPIQREVAEWLYVQELLEISAASWSHLERVVGPMKVFDPEN